MPAWMNCANPGIDGSCPVFWTKADTTNANITVSKCRSMAQAANYEYFGVEVGQVCFGSNSLPNLGPALGQYVCSMRCLGNTTSRELCGGNTALSVYVTRPLVPGILLMT